jgi:hypothetical protein
MASTPNRHKRPGVEGVRMGAAAPMRTPSTPSCITISVWLNSALLAKANYYPFSSAEQQTKIYRSGIRQNSFFPGEFWRIPLQQARTHRHISRD